MLIVGAAALAAAFAAITVVSFVPAASTRGRPSRAASPLAVGAAAEGDKKDQYDWQRVAEAKPQAGGIDPDAFPDLPDLPDPSAPVATGGVAAIGAQVKVKKVELPDLPGDPDLLPPAPNPITDGGLGLWEWTGIWILSLLTIALLGGAGSYLVSRATLEPEFADKALTFFKYFFGVFQVLFLARVLLTQFPKIDTTEMPWAPAHYGTEWILGPTRSVFKPEAGVDVAPIIWLLLTLLASELLTGPSGILMLAKDPQGLKMRPGMLQR